jgi:hypothetical protein
MARRACSRPPCGVGTCGRTHLAASDAVGAHLDRHCHRRIIWSGRTVRCGAVSAVRRRCDPVGQPSRSAHGETELGDWRRVAHRVVEVEQHVQCNRCLGSVPADPPCCFRWSAQPRLVGGSVRGSCRPSGRACGSARARRRGAWVLAFLGHRTAGTRQCVGDSSGAPCGALPGTSRGCGLATLPADFAWSPACAVVPVRPAGSFHRRRHVQARRRRCAASGRPRCHRRRRNFWQGLRRDLCPRLVQTARGSASGARLSGGAR